MHLNKYCYYEKHAKMQLKHSYYHFQHAISPEDCQRIIDLGTGQLERERREGINVEAYTFGDSQKGAMPGASPQGDATKQELKNNGINNAYVRDSEVTWLRESWLYDLFHPLINRANQEAGWNWQWDSSENFQFTVYKPGGFYSWHKDGMSDHFGAYKRYIYGVTPEPLKANGNLPFGYTSDDGLVGKVRKISMTCNLNVPGEYDGGNLMFDFGHHHDGDQFHECIEIRPQGSVIVFPSFIDHCVSPLTKGTRYSLVLWNLGDPFR
jgi:PKHD-type hydroxylase